MNRSIYIFMLLGLLFSVPAMAKTILVSPGNNKPISAAIRKASPGDTIIVAAGKYKEGTIVVNKSITLIGKNQPELDGEHKYEIMIITSDHVTIDGFVFSNSGSSSYEDIAALRIMQKGYITIRNNSFIRNFFGIYCQHAYSSTISNNQFRSNAKDEISSANGIHCWKSEKMLITNNDIIEYILTGR